MSAKQKKKMMRTQEIRYSVSILISLIISVLFFVACDDGKSISLPTISPVAQGNQPVASADTNAANSLTPSVQTSAANWVYEPGELPSGLIGTNSCTIGRTADADFTLHPGAGCWQKPIPGGVVRQQFQAGHLLSAPACNGGPADIKGIRLCGEPGLENPCGITGPRGCNSCPGTFEIVCH